MNSSGFVLETTAIFRDASLQYPFWLEKRAIAQEASSNAFSPSI